MHRRTIQYISAFLGLFLIIGGVIGYAGLANISTMASKNAVAAAQKRADEEVAKQLPTYVAKESDKRFNDPNIGAVIQSRVNDMAGTSLDNLIQEHVGPIVKQEVDARRDQIIRQARQQVNAPITAPQTSTQSSWRPEQRQLYAAAHAMPSTPIAELTCNLMHSGTEKALQNNFEDSGWKWRIKDCRYASEAPKTGTYLIYAPKPLFGNQDAMQDLVTGIKATLSSFGVYTGGIVGESPGPNVVIQFQTR